MDEWSQESISKSLDQSSKHWLQPIEQLIKRTYLPLSSREEMFQLLFVQFLPFHGSFWLRQPFVRLALFDGQAFARNTKKNCEHTDVTLVYSLSKTNKRLSTKRFPDSSRDSPPSAGICLGISQKITTIRRTIVCRLRLHYHVTSIHIWCVTRYENKCGIRFRFEFTKFIHKFIIWREVWNTQWGARLPLLFDQQILDEIFGVLGNIVERFVVEVPGGLGDIRQGFWIIVTRERREAR